MGKRELWPERKTPGAAGYDLKAAHGAVVPARGSAALSSGVVAVLDPGTVGLVLPRSGLAFRNRVTSHIGVIDSDYRKEIGLLLYNNGDEDYTVEAGDRVAQLVIVPCEMGGEAWGAVREGGFGSTGK
jgi:dUTP pyrophosphatase